MDLLEMSFQLSKRGWEGLGYLAIDRRMSVVGDVNLHLNKKRWVKFTLSFTPSIRLSYWPNTSAGGGYLTGVLKDIVVHRRALNSRQ
mgnify:CR=1 FL=1